MAPRFDDLVRSDQVEASSWRGIALESGKIKQGHYHSRTNVFVPKIVYLLRLKILIPERKHARIIVTEEMPSLFLATDHTFPDTVLVHTVPLIEPPRIPVMRAQCFNVLIKVRPYLALTREEGLPPGDFRIINDYRKMPVLK